MAGQPYNTADQFLFAHRIDQIRLHLPLTCIPPSRSPVYRSSPTVSSARTRDTLTLLFFALPRRGAARTTATGLVLAREKGVAQLFQLQGACFFSSSTGPRQHQQAELITCGRPCLLTVQPFCILAHHIEHKASNS